MTFFILANRAQHGGGDSTVVGIVSLACIALAIVVVGLIIRDYRRLDD